MVKSGPFLTPLIMILRFKLKSQDIFKCQILQIIDNGDFPLFSVSFLQQQVKIFIYDFYNISLKYSCTVTIILAICKIQ